MKDENENFVVVMAVMILVRIFWVVMPCIVAVGYQHF
jgi:hypothetical protein